MMITSSEGIELIKHFEGLSLEPYTCPAGFITIGYGHLLPANHQICTIDQRTAEAFLAQDLQLYEAAIIRNIIANLKQCEFDALASFTFNLGPAALQRSTLRQKINDHAEYADIGREFSRWIYASGRILNGLVRRRHAEARLFAGEYIWRDL